MNFGAVSKWALPVGLIVLGVGLAGFSASLPSWTNMVGGIALVVAGVTSFKK